jgi:hypothetical protein
MLNYTEKMKPIVEKFAKETLVYTNDCWDYIVTTELYAIFKAWTIKNHVHNCSQNVFTKNMKTLVGPSCERQREPGKSQIQNAVSMFRYTKLRDTQ